MVLNVGEALNAFRTAQKVGESSGDATPVSGPSFGDMLKGVVNDSMDSLKNAEKVSLSAVKGKAGVNEVITAVSSAEMALQTVVAIRDRVITAYQELMRTAV
jgi:flagellar hook-basal body complex protein FliE